MKLVYLKPALILSSFIFIFLSETSFCQSKAAIDNKIIPKSSKIEGKLVRKSPIQWFTFEQAMEKTVKEGNRPVLIDVYTDWCGWCDRMMDEAFADPFVANYINSVFYPVRFNAEGRDTIHFNQFIFTDTLIRNSHIHKLAIQLLDGQLAYPTLVYITRDGRKYSIPGYQKAPALFPRLVYFAENINNSEVNFDSFKTIFDDCFKDFRKPVDTVNINKVKWYTFQEASELNKKNPKKLFLDIYSDYGYASALMYIKTYNDPKIAALLNEKFYPVRLNVFSQDTIVFGKTFTNGGKQSYNFHQLAISLLKGNMDLPAVLFFDENSKLIFLDQEYLTPVLFEKRLKFVGENAYLTAKWDEYRKK